MTVTFTDENTYLKEFNIPPLDELIQIYKNQGPNETSIF